MCRTFQVEFDSTMAGVDEFDVFAPVGQANGEANGGVPAAAAAPNNAAVAAGLVPAVEAVLLAGGEADAAPPAADGLPQAGGLEHAIAAVGAPVAEAALIAAGGEGAPPPIGDAAAAGVAALWGPALKRPKVLAAGNEGKKSHRAVIPGQEWAEQDICLLCKLNKKIEIEGKKHHGALCAFCWAAVVRYGRRYMGNNNWKSWNDMQKAHIAEESKLNREKALANA